MQLKRNKLILLALSIGIMLVFTRGIIYGGETMASLKEDLTNLKMSYRLEGAYMPYEYIQIDISGTGVGKLGYSLYREYIGKDKEKTKTITFKIDEDMIKRLASLYRYADFLHLNLVDLNKDGIRVTDVGKTTLSYSYIGQERTLSYGYVENNPLEDLVSLYWQLVREYLPKQETLSRE